MGERQRRIREQTRQDKAISTGTAELPPIKLPDFALRYLGEEVFNGLKIMISELAEFEPLVTQDKFSVKEIIEYLGCVGFFDNYPKDLEYLALTLDRYRGKVHKELSKKMDSKRVTKTLFQSRIDISAAVDSESRPLANIVMHDLWAAAESLSFGVFMEKVDQDSKFESMARDLVESSLQIESHEREFADRIKAYFFVRALSRDKDFLQKKGEASSDVTSTMIKEAEIVPGEYQIALDGLAPFVTKISIKKSETMDPFMLGELVVDWNDPTNYNQPQSTILGVSRFTGDICPFGMHFVSLARAFQFYGISDRYPDFQNKILTSIENGMKDGSIITMIDDEPGAEKTVDPVIALSTDDTSVPEEQPVYKFDKKMFEKSVETEESPVSVSPDSFQENERKGQKVGVLRNISYRTAVAAFEKLGFRVVSGGRHDRLVSADGKRSVVFMVPHSGATNDVSYILKKTLRLLSISPKEFAEKL